MLAQFPVSRETVAYLVGRSIGAKAGPRKHYSTAADAADLYHEAEDQEVLGTSCRIVDPKMGVWPEDAPDAHPRCGRADSPEPRGAMSFVTGTAMAIRSDLWAACTGSERASLLESATLVRLTAREVLIEQGAPADCMFVVRSGELEVLDRGPQGAERAFAELKPGDVVGEQAALGYGGRVRNATVRARTPAELLRIPYAALEPILARRERFRAKFRALGRERSRERIATFVSRVDAASLRRFIEGAPFVDVPAGGTIFTESDAEADSAYVIVSGEVAVEAQDGAATRVVAVLGSGEWLGERAVLNEEARTTSATALVPSRVVEIEGARLRAAVAESPSMQAYFSTLERSYNVSNLGYVTSHEVSGDSRELLTTYQLQDGRRIGCVLAPFEDVFSAAVLNTEVVRQLQYLTDQSALHLELDASHRICGVRATNVWADLPSAMRLLLDGVPVSEWQIARFEESGRLGERRLQTTSRAVTVCECVGTTENDILKAVDAGACSTDELREAFGCGSVCGGCIPRLGEYLNQSRFVVGVLQTVTRLSLDAYRIRLAHGRQWQHRPGQHIVVRDTSGAVKRERAYTVVQSGDGWTDIVVRRLPGGRVSEWLCNPGHAGKAVSVSAPQGTFVWEARPAVVIVAGIGVTVAASFLSAARDLPLCVIYVCRSRSEAPLRDELEAAMAERSGSQLNVWETSLSGRPPKGFFASLAQSYPERDFYLCGPSSFMDVAGFELLTAGIPPKRLHTEEFRAAPRTTAAHVVRTTAAHVVPPEVVREESLQPLLANASHSILEQASSFVRQIHDEAGTSRLAFERIAQIEREIIVTGTYRQTLAELEAGARLAWRNAGRCIGRLHWDSIQVRDCRQLNDHASIFEALSTHVRQATRGGDLVPMVSIFPPADASGRSWRIWNPQLIRYAGYREAGGGVVGDPMQADLTERILALGWKPERRGRFDVLPLVIQSPSGEVRWFELPPDAVLQVPIAHPDYPWFGQLGLRWYALPAVSDMRMSIGGVEYPLAPFNGWYMSTEIGARNFSDEDRYNMLYEVATRLGLDTDDDASLWRDRAALELTRAVTVSFRLAGVRIADHHQASQDFVLFVQNEHEAGRSVPMRWSWIVPPVGGGTTGVFFLDEDHFRDEVRLPAILPQARAW